MLTYMLKPVLEFMNFMHKSFSLVLTTSYHIGRAMILVFLKICHFVGDIFAALGIIGEELYHFVCELQKSLSAVSLYVQTSANGGINCVIEALVVFFRHIGKFFTNTKLHSKLLATNLGVFLCYLFNVVKNALLLIADSTWWLVMLVPRLFMYSAIAVGDFLVNFITAIRRAVTYTITVVVEDIFRLTIAVVLLIVLWHNRRRLGLALLRSGLYVKRALRYCYRRLTLLRFSLFHRRPTTVSIQTTSPTRTRVHRPSVSPSLSDKSIDPQQRCVVCRDRQKCVLLLPCKHLCMCDECADYLIYSTQCQKCPLCRTNIDHSMSVYT